MDDSPAPLSNSSLSGLRHTVRNEDVSFDIVKPFGPSVLETQLPENIFSAMLAMTDEILADANRESWGPYLVGQIREEPGITEQAMTRHGVLDYLKRMYAEFVIANMYANADPKYQHGVDGLRSSGEYRNPTRIEIESAWVVSQQAGEYNPIHNHSQATMASVMYLKVPQQIESGKTEIPHKIATDGYIEFVDRSAGGSEQFGTSSVRVQPRAGRFYIFPASLLHLVYPYRGEGERRSVAINVSHSF